MAQTHRVRFLRSPLPGVQVVEAKSSRSFARHSHDQFGIGFIVGGAQRSASGRGPVEAGPGDVITVNPGEVHDGIPIGHEGRYWRMFYVDQAVVSGIAGEFTETTHYQFEFRDPVVQNSRLVPALSWLFACAAMEGQEREAFAKESLLSILGEVAGASVKRPDGLRHRIGPALRMIDEAPADALTLDDLARLCGLSTYQLLRGFVAVTGLTPHAYILQRRVEVARRLIRRAVPLAEAALEAGFADQSHMTRAFAARYGYSPGAYAAAFL